MTSQEDTLAARIRADLDLPRRPRQTRSRAKHAAILRAAAQLFARHGYDQTTTPAIAEAAQLSVGTLYAYFRDKRQIFLTLVADNLDSLTTISDALRDWGHAPRQHLRQLLARAMPYDAADHGLQRAWLNLQQRDAASAVYGAAANEIVYTALLAGLERLAAQGRTWPDLDLPATSWAITHLLDHVWHTQLDPTRLNEAEYSRQRDALADLIYHAVCRASDYPPAP